jgi:hypothetical protein
VTLPIPVVIDTDIGADPDDALALVLALASPEVDVRGVTIVSGTSTCGLGWLPACSAWLDVRTFRFSEDRASRSIPLAIRR